MDEIISPIEGRYGKTVNPLRKYLSEDAFYSYRVKVEVSYFKFFLKTILGKDFSGLEINLLERISNTSKEDVEKIKKIETVGDILPATKHDVKAIEYFIKDYLKRTTLESFLEFVHFGLTSEDVNNVAYGVILSKSINEEIIPSLDDICKNIDAFALKYKEVPMLARTHNQPASPTTLGKEFANFSVRVKRQIKNLENQRISVKLNGATGNYNSFKLAYPQIDWSRFSADYLENISNETNTNLEIVLLTTQIIPGDSYAELFNTIKLTSTILQGFCEDVWEYIGRDHLILKNEKGAVGSSTMPHKINPIDFENAEGNYKKVKHLCNIISEELPISRQQRDLSDSTIKREFGDILGRFYIANESLVRGLSKISPNLPSIQKELIEHPEVITEGIQTILRLHGCAEPYEKMKEFSQGKKVSLEEIRMFVNSLDISRDLKNKLSNLSPENYCGLASELVK